MRRLDGLAAGEGDEVVRLHLETLQSLSLLLSAEAGKLTDRSQSTKAYDKPVVDGIGAIARVAEKIADLLERVSDEPGKEDDDHADVDRFFAAIDERIDERARERARAMAGVNADATCPQCGAALRPAGAA